MKMKKGRIIFLNGVTSTGKTSIVDALQSREDIFFYVVANDLFQEMIGEKYLRENYWKYLSDAILIMYHTAKLISDQGKNGNSSDALTVTRIQPIKIALRWAGCVLYPLFHAVCAVNAQTCLNCYKKYSY